MGVCGVIWGVFGVFAGFVFITFSVSGSEPFTPIIILRSRKDVFFPKPFCDAWRAVRNYCGCVAAGLLEFYPSAAWAICMFTSVHTQRPSRILPEGGVSYMYKCTHSCGEVIFRT